jgi:hypothetical protein
MDDELRSEIARLHAEIARLHTRLDQLHAHATVRHVWMRRFVKDLETNPASQYKVHLWGAIYWLINFPAVTALFFLAPGLWVKLGVFITLFYSIYSNFATDYGSMSAALSAMHEPPLPEIPAQVPPGSAI